MVNITGSFTGSIPEYYDRYMGPAWFEAFGADIAARLPASPPGDVLEIASGTGIVTRQLRERLDPSRRLVASDISTAMLDYGRNKLAGHPGIEWHEADATRLPFADGEFGAVVCAFGVMFVPDKPALFREARRVLKAGGTFLFNVWDRMESNPHAVAYAAVMEALFPGDAEMRFTVPYDMHDPALLRRFLGAAGFREERIETRQCQVQGVSARELAEASIRGTPRSLLIEKRGIPLEMVIDRIAAALARTGGADPYRGEVNAVVVEARAA